MTAARCPLCDAPATERAGRITLAHLTWCPRVRPPQTYRLTGDAALDELDRRADQAEAQAQAQAQRAEAQRAEPTATADDQPTDRRQRAEHARRQRAQIEADHRARVRTWTRPVAGDPR